MVLRDTLILLLINGCGLRISEPLHLWIHDVNILNKTIRIFHPKIGKAPGEDTRKSRQEYLWENYKLKPRTDIMGNQHLGWKSVYVNKEGAIDLFWKDDELKDIFFDIWTIYLSYLAVLDINHPYAFINFNSNGIEFQDTVKPKEDDSVIIKNHINAFLNTNLKEILDSHQVTELVVIGAMSHMCVDAAVRAASDSGYKVKVVHDACATLDLEFNGFKVPAAYAHATLMAAFQFAYAQIISTEDYVN